MNAENATVESTTPEKTPAPVRDIVRGRMPVAVVYLARFGAQSGKSTKDKAVAFGTTVGKIDDIAKGRNFGYVTADFRPTESQKADGISWLNRVPGGSAEALQELQNLELATPEQASAFEQVRSSARGQSTVTKSGEPVADAGGGNRRTSKGKGKSNATADAPLVDSGATADALLN